MEEDNLMKEFIKVLVIIFSLVGFAITAEVSSTSYTAIPEISFQWITVDSNGASTVIDDQYVNDFQDYILQGSDDYFIYKLPFIFPFRGRNIVNISVNTNGLIELLETQELCRFWCGIWSTHYHGEYASRMDAIFASNDDLVTDGPNEYVGVFNQGDKVVVEWKGKTYQDAESGEGQQINFQVILYSDGTVTWNFKEMNWESFDNTDGDMFTGAYSKEGDLEFEADYEIKRQTSFTFDFSAAPTTTSTTTIPSTSTTTTPTPTSTTATTSTSTSTTIQTTTSTTTSSTTTTILDLEVQRVVVLANSIDFSLAKNFFTYLRGQELDVLHISAENYEEHKDENLIILGGPDTPEGVGEIVQNILTINEQESIREPRSKKIYIKSSESGKILLIIAGSNRNYTAEAHHDNRELVTLELQGD
jgi:hypothetical protein